MANVSLVFGIFHFMESENGCLQIIIAQFNDKKLVSIITIQLYGNYYQHLILFSYLSVYLVSFLNAKNILNTIFSISMK